MRLNFALLWIGDCPSNTNHMQPPLGNTAVERLALSQLVRIVVRCQWQTLQVVI
jgi:hypothetical protein